MAVFAWRFNSDNRPSRSAILEHSGKENGDQMEHHNLTYSRAVSYDQVAASHHYAGRKRTRQKIQTQNRLEVAIHSMKYLQRQSLPIK
jgi:hypothetical protein